MKKNKILLLTATVVIALAIYLFWGNNSIKTTEYSVSPDNLPDGFDGYRIVQISDLHNKDFGSVLTEKIASLSPDIIVITGDIIDSYHTKTEVSAEFVNQVCKIAPVYYVTGNHESRIDEYASFRTQIEEYGVNILENENVFIEKNGDEICITGVNDANFFGTFELYENQLKFEKMLAELSGETEGKTSILLSHRPEHIDIYAKNGFDLVFSGHAHGGQIRLPFVGGLFAPGQGFFPEYTSGVYSKGKTNMIVSRGLGNSLFPFRVFNRPEIVVCDLVKGK